MLDSIENAYTLLVDSIKVFFKHPILIIPLLLCWLIYAPIILYFTYKFNWDEHSMKSSLLITLGIIFVFSTILSISNLILLEFIEGIELRGKASFFNSIYQAFIKDRGFTSQVQRFC